VSLKNKKGRFLARSNESFYESPACDGRMCKSWGGGKGFTLRSASSKPPADSEAKEECDSGKRRQDVLRRGSSCEGGNIASNRERVLGRKVQPDEAWGENVRVEPGGSAPEPRSRHLETEKLLLEPNLNS